MRIVKSLSGPLRRLALASLVLIGVAATTPAQALSLNWTLSGPGTANVSSLGNNGIANYAISGVGSTPQIWTLSTTATETKTYFFDWMYTGFHGLSGVTATLTSASLGTLVNDGPSNIGATPAGGFTYSGSRLAWNANVGDVLVFTLGGSNTDPGASDLIAGVVSVSSVPLPAPLLLGIAAFAGLFGWSRRRTDAMA